MGMELLELPTSNNSLSILEPFISLFSLAILAKYCPSHHEPSLIDQPRAFIETSDGVVKLLILLISLSGIDICENPPLDSIERLLPWDGRSVEPTTKVIADGFSLSFSSNSKAMLELFKSMIPCWIINVAVRVVPQTHI